MRMDIRRCSHLIRHFGTELFSGSYWSVTLLLWVTLLTMPGLTHATIVATVKTNIPFSFKATCPDSPVKTNSGYAVDLACFDSGIKARNEHMLADLNVANFPVARLDNGNLILNGTSKPVKISVVNSKQVFSFKLSDFGIPARSHLGLKIQDEISVEVGP